MINQLTQNENTQNQFSNVIRELQIGKLLRKANITKSCGVSAYEIFQFLLLLVFQGKNLFRFLNSKRKDMAVSKNTYYRFLNNVSFNDALPSAPVCKSDRRIQPSYQAGTGKSADPG